MVGRDLKIHYIYGWKYIIKDKLRIRCAYSLKLNENNEPKEVEEAALRLSIKGLDYDKSIKDQITGKFSDTKVNGTKRKGALKWDYDLKNLMKAKKNEDIEEKMNNCIKWVNDTLKAQI